ncbi:hypothetical protein D9M73_248480 [compost metagenome]
MPGRIASTAEESRVAERQQARIADQEVEGACEQREAQHLEHEHRVGAGQRRDQQASQQCAVERPPRQAARRLQPGCSDSRSVHHFSFPNNPAGRSSSTTTMITNTTVDDPSG